MFVNAVLSSGMCLVVRDLQRSSQASCRPALDRIEHVIPVSLLKQVSQICWSEKGHCTLARITSTPAISSLPFHAECSVALSACSSKALLPTSSGFCDGSSPGVEAEDGKGTSYRDL